MEFCISNFENMNTVFLSGSQELRKKMTRACMQPSCFQKSEEHMELNQGCNEYDIHT